MPQTYQRLEPYTIEFVSASGFQRTHPRPNPPTGCGVIALFHLLTAADMPAPRALHHSIRLSERIPMRYLPTRSDRWLWSCPPSWLWLSRHLPPRLRATEGYSHATASSLIPFDSSQPADSSGPSPDPIRPLAVELSPFFTCWQLQICQRLEPYTIRFTSASGFQWAICRPDPTAGCEATLLPDSSCPGTFYPALELQKATDMPLPRALYLSMRLSERIPADPSLTQSAHWL